MPKLEFLYSDPEILVVDKPTHIATHRSDPSFWGIKEILESQLHEELFVVHRLDRDTSGVLLLAKTPEAAAKYSQAFADAQIKKIYVFLTDKEIAETDIDHAAPVELKDGSEKSASTNFRKLQKLGSYTLWQAEPQTGRTHQIRKHAADIGIAVLGDENYGGSPFNRLCLHALSLTVQERIFVSENPFGQEFSGVVSALDTLKRQRKLIDSDALKILRVRDGIGVDIWRNILWTTDTAAIGEEFSQSLAKKLNCEAYVIQSRPLQRGSSEKHYSNPPPPETWQVEEHAMKLEIRRDQGHAAGLFLDQRRNRLWVKENSRDRRVLNLFSYTGAFSVMAAAGSARVIDSVDSTAKYQDWAKCNFLLNDLKTEAHFYVDDAIKFCERAVRRGQKYDLLIIDPPSFSRGKTEFQIAKDLPRLMQLASQLAAPSCDLLVSCNYQVWNQRDFERSVKSALPDLRHWQALDWDPHDLDSRPGSTSLHSLILRRLRPEDSKSLR